MDEMKIKLSSSFMRGIIANMIENAVGKSIGIKPSISINEANIEMKDGEINFHFNIDGSINNNVLVKINRMLESDSK